MLDEQQVINDVTEFARRYKETVYASNPLLQEFKDSVDESFYRFLGDWEGFGGISRQSYAKLSAAVANVKREFALVMLRELTEQKQDMQTVQGKLLTLVQLESMPAAARWWFAHKREELGLESWDLLSPSVIAHFLTPKGGYVKLPYLVSRDFNTPVPGGMPQEVYTAFVQVPVGCWLSNLN